MSKAGVKSVSSIDFSIVLSLSCTYQVVVDTGQKSFSLKSITFRNYDKNAYTLIEI